MKGIIYKATCKTTGLCYIGQTTKPLEQRAKEHWYRRKDGTKFHNAILEYGRNDFTWETIDTCDTSKLDERENYWISYYDSYENGLNEDKGIGFPEALRHPSDKMNKSRSKKMKKEWETNYDSRCAANVTAWNGERKEKHSQFMVQYNIDNPISFDEKYREYISEKTKEGMNNPITKGKCAAAHKDTHRVYHPDGTWHMEK